MKSTKKKSRYLKVHKKLNQLLNVKTYKSEVNYHISCLQIYFKLWAMNNLDIYCTQKKFGERRIYSSDRSKIDLASCRIYTAGTILGEFVVIYLEYLPRTERR